MEVISKQDLIRYISSEEGVKTYLNKGIKGVINSLPFGEYVKTTETTYIKVLLIERDKRVFVCAKCGKKLRGDENFCGYCGRKVLGVG